MVFNSFLGALSQYGFISYFDCLTDNSSDIRTLIIKGGPGCGKSSLMKRLAERAETAGLDAELVHCSSDPFSLDAVIIPALHFAIADGTAPHILEPSIPVAKQCVLSLYDCIDEGALRPRAEELIRLFGDNSRCFERANRFISAASSVCGDLERTAEGFLRKEKLTKYIDNLCRRLFGGSRKSAADGRETVRFISTATPNKITDFTEQNLACFTYRYILKDRFGAFGHFALELLRERALSNGYDIVTGKSFLSPYDRTDAVFIPALSACFVTSGFLTPAAADGCRIIHDARFYDTDEMKKHLNRLNFCKKTALCLIEKGCDIMGEAKSIHDEIEEIYKNAFDFGRLQDRELELYEKLGI